MIRNMKRGIPSLFKKGTSVKSGMDDAVSKNLEACKQLTEITRTSLGPNGMNKLLINHLDKLFVTSDTATIMREMEVQHPAAKIIVMAAQMQEQEIGDGSNLVVCIAGELLGNAMELIQMGLHPSEILKGYDLAGKKALEILKDLVVMEAQKADLTNPEFLAKACKSCIAAKQFGREEFLSKLVAQACASVMPANPYNFAVDNVRVVKVLGGDLKQSEVVRGIVVSRGSTGSVVSVDTAKIAVFTCALDTAESETKGTVLIENADELMQYNEGEEKHLEQQIKAIADSGVTVVIAGGSVGDMAQHFLDKYNLLCVKVVSKFELRRICRATKSRPLVALGGVDPEHLGHCSKVFVREIGAQKVTVFEQDPKNESAVATILLRGSTSNMLADVERAIDDGVNTVRALGRDARFLAGAGACDIELARRLMDFGMQTTGLEQYAIKKFAQSFEVVPRILADNAGKTAIDVISELYAEHEKGNTTLGVNVEGDKPVNAEEVAIYDLMATKQQALTLAVESVLTVLRVDQIIMAKPAGGPKVGGRQGHWDDDD